MLRKLILTSAAFTVCILLTAAVPATAPVPMAPAASTMTAAPVKAPVMAAKKAVVLVPVKAPAKAPAAAPMVVKAPVAAPTPAPVMTAATPAATPVAMAAAPATTLATTPTAKKDATGSVVGGALLQILIVILTIAIPIVLTPVVRWLLKKMKVEDLKTIQMVDATVDAAVVMGLNYANEQAHKLGDNPVQGAEKLAAARDQALAYLKDSGIVSKSATYIEGLIESKLGATREDKPTGEAAAPKALPRVEDKAAEEAK